MTSSLRSWGRVPASTPAHVVPLTWRHALPAVKALPGPVLPYGLGRSYGDSCLNNDGTLLDARGLDRFLAFDTATGRIRCEAGVSLSQILDVCVPMGWFLPVTPGTQYVTVAGAIANDVHGKNHHVAGTFGCFVTALELHRSDGAVLELTPNDDTGLFAATIGGLGLTGLITWAEIQLIPITSDQINLTQTRFTSLQEFFALSEAAAHEPYTVAWIDALSAQGRGLFMQGHHAAGTLPPPRSHRPKLRAPLDAPGWALNPLTMRAFNEAFYRKQFTRIKRARVHYLPFFYPLDAVADWNRIYGSDGFFQYQCVVPFTDGLRVTQDLLNRLAKAGAASFLAVLKTFGHVPSPGLLSFPRPGITLALDIPNRGEETLRLMQTLNQIAIDAGGALYPAKDATMTGDQFRASYPALDHFVPHVDPAFSSSFWRRVMGE